MRLINSDSSGEEIGQLTETLTTRAVSLRNKLGRILKNPVIEPQPLIEQTMAKLKSALEAQNKALPKVGMDDAWNDLRTAVNAL
jgi:hypothetical protein